jgi:hypothetical protein
MACIGNEAGIATATGLILMGEKSADEIHPEPGLSCARSLIGENLHLY